MARTEPEPRSISRRLLLGAGVLALANAACQKAEATLNQRTYVAVAPRGSDISNGGVVPREVPTPIPTATPKTSEIPPTPTSVATPDTRPSSPWPPEMVQQLRELTVLDEDRLRFGYYTDRTQIPYPDIYAMFTSDGSGNADIPRRMVHVLATNRVQREWFVLIVGHERGHFHQAEQSRLNGMDPDARPNFQQSYLNTQEGREFVAASNAANEYARGHRIDMTAPLMHSPFGANHYEDAADVISFWFNRRSALEGIVWSPVRDWAAKWLHR